MRIMPTAENNGTPALAPEAKATATASLGGAQAPIFFPHILKDTRGKGQEFEWALKEGRKEGDTHKKTSPTSKLATHSKVQPLYTYQGKIGVGGPLTHVNIGEPHEEVI